MSESNLERGLTEVDESRIDTFTDFPTKEAIACQLFYRQLGTVLGLQYFTDKADFISELMRSFQRKSRFELVLSMYKDFNLMSRALGVEPYNIPNEEPKR